MSALDNLMQRLWLDYSTVNLQAGAIHSALEGKGERVVNDHIAFRTFDLPKVGIDVMAQTFMELGYELKGKGYDFPEKKLTANHYEHPNPNQPKVFISALKLDSFSSELKRTVNTLVDEFPEDLAGTPNMLIAGALWKPVSWQVYQDLLRESEYAAWMAAHGFRVNHFTVSFNALKNFQDMNELNDFIESLGYELNTSGGRLKGSPGELLEQSSTLAYPVRVPFFDGMQTIPGCYYEFSRRYPGADGKLFQGFVPQSANKLFESTHHQKKAA